MLKTIVYIYVLVCVKIPHFIFTKSLDECRKELERIEKRIPTYEILWQQICYKRLKW